MCKLSAKPLLVFGLSMAVFFAFAVKTHAQRKVSSSRSGSASIASITAQKIKDDIAGRMIYDVPSEEAGEGRMDWQFSYGQFPQIEILQKVSYGNTSTVEASIYAQKAGPDFDGYVGRLRGVARLYYQLSRGWWQLTRIESINLRHSDVLSGSRISNTYRVYPASTSIVPGGVTVSVAPGKFQSYNFRVADRATVSGRFRARGGPGNDIEVYILDEDGFMNWSNNHGSPAYYNSGRLTAGTIKTPLNAGSYYLVFNNSYSPADPKTVEVSVELRRDSVLYDEFGRNYASYGRAPMSRVDRIYTSSVSPPQIPTPNPPVRVAVDQPSIAQIPSPVEAPKVVVKPVVFAAVGGYSSDRFLSKTFEVRKRNDEPFPVVLTRRGTLRGNFRVLNGGDKDIEVFIMTAKEYDRWTDRGTATASVLYASGQVTNATLTRSLDAGTYYIVFSNHDSSKAAKTVEANFSVEYTNR